MNIEELSIGAERMIGYRPRRSVAKLSPQDEAREIALGYGDKLYAVESLAPQFCLLFGLAAHELSREVAVLIPGVGPTPEMRRFLEVLEDSVFRDVIERLAQQRAIGRSAGAVK